MEKEFVPHEESFELKELGFDEPCLGYWNTDPYFGKPIFYMVIPFDHEWCLPAPLYQQAFRWFRERYGLFVKPNKRVETEGVLIDINWHYFIIETKRTDVCEGSFIYEEAELSCLRRLIVLVKMMKESGIVS